MRAYPKLPMNSYICALLYNGICRISVPLFFMISGALLLEKPIDYQKSNRRTISIFIKTALWTLIFLVWNYFYLGQRYALTDIFSSPVRVHFWFLYVLFGIYLTLPLWQKLVSGEDKRLIRYFSILFIAVLTINFVLGILKMRVTYEIPLIGSSCYAGYFIMGYVIRHYINDIKIKKWICVAALIICIAATDLLTFFTSYKANSHIETYSDFRSVFIGVSAITVFYLFMKAKEFKPNSFISLMSKHSFNIYMIHVFYLDIIQVNIDITKFSAWIGFPVFFIFMITLSFVSSWLLELAKGKNKSII